MQGEMILMWNEDAGGNPSLPAECLTLAGLVTILAP